VLKSLDDHVNVGLEAISEPPASRTLAAIIAVSPGAANTSESGKSLIEAAACWIEVAAAADADPAVAVMEVVPLLTAVIRPSADTLAMVSSS